MNGFSVTSDRFFLPFLSPFFLPNLGPQRAVVGPLLDQNGTILGVNLDHFRVDPGSFGGHLGIILASCWHHFRAVLCVFDPFGRLFGPFKPKTGVCGGGVKKCSETLKPYFEEDT